MAAYHLSIAIAFIVHLFPGRQIPYCFSKYLGAAQRDTACATIVSWSRVRSSSTERLLTRWPTSGHTYLGDARSSGNGRHTGRDLLKDSSTFDLSDRLWVEYRQSLRTPNV